MHQHQRIVVDVDDPTLRCDRLGDLMSAVRGGQTDADIEELADAALSSQEPYHPGEEGPVRSGSFHDLGAAADYLFSSMAIGQRSDLCRPASRRRHGPDAAQKDQRGDRAQCP